MELIRTVMALMALASQSRSLWLVLLMAVLSGPTFANVNVALASNGAVATASSSAGPEFDPKGAIDGQHLVWADPPGYGWKNGNQNMDGEWLQVNFAGNQTISEIDVWSISDDNGASGEPGPTTTFSNANGNANFEIQYWTGSAWANVPGGNVTSNNLVKRSVTFSPITTSRIRYVGHASLSGFTRLVELEAYGAVLTVRPRYVPPSPNLALGKPATESSNHNGTYPASYAVDGDPSTFSHTDADPAAWLEVDLQANYPIDTVHIINRQDCCASRLADFTVYVSSTPFTSSPSTQPGVNSFYRAAAVGTDVSFAIGFVGRYVRIQLNGTDYLHIGELQVFGAANVYNASFEYLDQGIAGDPNSYTGSPLTAVWDFSDAGLTANNTDKTTGNPNAPDGYQAAYIHGSGFVDQYFPLAAGSYYLSFKAAQRATGQSGTQAIRADIDGTPVGTLTPSGIAYERGVYTFSVASGGSHRIRLSGVGSGADYQALVDDISISTSPPTSLIAIYHLEETSWNGVAGEVIDASGNGHGGKGISTAMPSPQTASPAIAGSPGTCGYAGLPGPSLEGPAFEFASLPISATAGDVTSVALWLYWDGVDDESLIDLGAYRIVLYDHYVGFTTASGNFYSVSSSGLANGWHHFAATFVNGNVGANKIWIDGVSQTLATPGGYLAYDNSTAYPTTTLLIGANSVNNYARLSGRVDEINVFSGTLTPSEIAALMTSTHACLVQSAPGGFNAFESATAAGAVSGVIHTKVSGAAFTIDLVALDAPGTSVLSAFTGDVKVELLDAHDDTGALTGSCRASWVASSGNVAATLTLAGGDAGRKSVSLSDTDAWRNVRVRISYPATGTPTVVGCSTDNFAIRPSQFISFAATDATSSTAGTARSLTNTSASGGVVHKAGQPFTVAATAVNSLAGTTTHYDGTPSLVLSNCGGTACAAGWVTVASEGQSFTLTAPKLVRYGLAPQWVYQTLSGSVNCNGSLGDPYPGFAKHCDVGNFGTLGVASGAAAAAGVINMGVSYSEAGSFGAQLLDTSFAAVDAADGSSFAERAISSSIIGVGRFVPDHFDVTSLAAPTLKTFDSTLCGSRSFTYVGQPFGYSAVAQATVLPRNAAGTTTVNYTGALWKLSTSSVTQAYTVTPATPTLDVTGVAAAALTDNTDGTGLLVGNSADKIRFNRPTASPIAPFSANIALTWSVQDASEAAVTGNGSISTPSPLVFSTIAFDSGSQMRFGAIRLTPAYGSELIDLPVLVEAQYWDGVRMATNTADQCTALPAATVTMNNYQRNLSACKTAIGGAMALANGRTWAKLKKPGNGNNGSVNVTLQLGAAPSGLTCTAVNAAAVSSSTANLPWLQGKWNGASAFDQNPVTRASFGQYRSPMIYQRESF